MYLNNIIVSVTDVTSVVEIVIPAATRRRKECIKGTGDLIRFLSLLILLKPSAKSWDNYISKPFFEINPSSGNGRLAMGMIAMRKE